MNMHPTEQYFKARCEALSALSQAVIHPHHGEAGTAREFLLSEFLRNHLPSALRIGSGQVFGHEWAQHGNDEHRSKQQDVVIYRSDFPILQVAQKPLFFLESVVATVESKTTYIADDLAGILQNVASVRRIQPADVFTFQLSADGPKERLKPRRVLCGVFYFHGPKFRTPLVKQLNTLLAEQKRQFGCLSSVPGPDFLFSVDSGLIVRNQEFNTLFENDVSIEGMNKVANNLTPDEEQDGAYRRVFGDSEKWRGLQAIILELTERCQRYSASYASLSKYV